VKYLCSSSVQLDFRTGFHAAWNNFVLRIIVHRKLSPTLRVSHKRGLLTDVAVERNERVSNRVIYDVTPALISKGILDEPPRNRIVSFVDLAHDDRFR
jgi:hypothetical protein